MGIQFVQAQVVLELIWRLNFLCIYINMGTIVGTSAGLPVFISLFSTMLYKLQKMCKVLIN